MDWCPSAPNKGNRVPYHTYFFNQIPQLLFILQLVLCGYYSRAAFISLEILETSTKRGTSETVKVARRCQ